MLSQLNFKRSVEDQYKQGIEKMIKLYAMEGDRKSKLDAENKRIESTQKLRLLDQALKRYEQLNIPLIDGPDGGDGKACPGVWLDQLADPSQMIVSTSPAKGSR